jgi:hypothetical protein
LDRLVARRLRLPDGIEDPSDFDGDGSSSAERSAIARRCADMLLTQASVRSRNRRLTIIQVLVELFPEAEPEVRRVFSNRSVAGIAEVHFTLCLFLLNSQRSVQQKATLLHDFLMRSRNDAGSASFNAGCVLGWDFPPKLAVPLLLDVLRHSRYVEARASAIHGFEHLLKRIPQDGAASRRVRATLLSVSKHDPQRRVRARAKSCLEQHAADTRDRSVRR